MTTPAENQQAELSREDIEQRIRALGPWFHNINLHGVQTAPDHFLGDYPSFKWKRFQHAIPLDLRGQTVLDIGCNAGFYSIEMKLRGADRVLGIDSDDHYLRQAKFAAEVLGVDVEFRNLSVFDLPKLDEQFDIVFFMGVLYHLRYPLLALDLIREFGVRKLLIFQSMLRGSTESFPTQQDYPFTETAIFEEPSFPKMFFVEHQYAGDPTNWWIPNRACVEAMIRSARFEIVDQPEDEVFICRPK